MLGAASLTFPECSFYRQADEATDNRRKPEYHHHIDPERKQTHRDLDEATCGPSPICRAVHESEAQVHQEG